MTMLHSRRDMGGPAGRTLVSRLLTAHPCRAAVKDYVSGRIPNLLHGIKTYLNTPDYCRLVSARRCQIPPTMAPLKVPYFIGMYLEDGSCNARERVAVATVVRVQGIRPVLETHVVVQTPTLLVSPCLLKQCGNTPLWDHDG